MKLAYYIKKNSLKDDIRVSKLLDTLRDGGCLLYDVLSRDGLEDGTEALLSIGGDGTFLSAARVAAPAGVPVLALAGSVGDDLDLDRARAMGVTAVCSINRAAVDFSVSRHQAGENLAFAAENLMNLLRSLGR